MRGKYSPTVSAAYNHNQDWWDQYANPPGAETWNLYDPEGYDSYGYDRNHRDRAGNYEYEYYATDYEDEYSDTNFAYEEGLDTWTFDGVKPVKRS